MNANAREQQISLNPAPFRPGQDGLLQRKCACGNKTIAGGECSQCAKKKNGLQRKLSIGTSNNPLEREADRVADTVVRMPGTRNINDVANNDGVYQSKGKIIQTKTLNNRQQEISKNTNVNYAGSGGKPLTDSSQDYFESRFGRDLSHIRIHDSNSDYESAQSLNAKAYTLGNHLVFNKDQYSPETQSGKRLLAHEITHSIQQSGGQSSLDSESPEITSVNESLIQRDLFDDFVELVADDEAQQVISNLRRSVEISPRFFLDIFVGEVLDSIREHWPEFFAITLGLIVAEGLIAVLAASPTGVTQFIAAILQAIVIIVLAYFAVVEMGGAVQEGMNWFRLCMEAGNNEQILEQASRAFLRMLRHVVLALLLILGVRARVQGAGAITRAGTARANALGSQRPLPTGEPPPGVVRIGSHPRFRSSSGANVGTSAGRPAASLATEGALARSLPVTEPIPAPFTTPAPRSIPNIGPRASVPIRAIDVASATVAGVSAATSTTEEDQRRRSCLEQNPYALICQDEIDMDESVQEFIMRQGYGFESLGDCSPYDSHGPGIIDQCNGALGQTWHCSVSPYSDPISRVNRPGGVVSVFSCLCCRLDGTTGFEWRGHHWSPGR